MASARARHARTTWCRHCGASLSAAASARSVRCALCHAETRVERRPQHQGGLHQAMGFIKGLFNNAFGSASATSQPPPSSSESMRAGDAYGLPASYPRDRSSKKRALLVGISYAFTKYELKGSVNDVNCMRYLLRDKFNFPTDCILTLTPDEKDPYRVPTKDNLRLAMRWLVEGCTSGDSLVFHFSGHGVQKLDNNGDEMDGYDEALCPQDFEDRGVILDDEINETIVRPLGPGVKLHAIIDTCHSGTILDLPYLCRISRLLAMGEPGTSAGDAERHERRHRHLVQRLRRQPELGRHHVLLRLRLDRRHDVQLHQGGVVGAGPHIRPLAQRHAGHDPRQRRRVWHPWTHRLLLPPGHHLQLRTGATTVRVRDI
ncbi:metacaspase-1 isoform X3 [Brachypodium distachyon]|uniref:metacaspase-1 isoform X3 n=1 Tax=Brachypodium distachyon TaxID=15368 RepID=UPI00071D4880|nr:metacaspase-1 isoform X3 [Brachypodium distachyon]|eukprot:XP_014755558.1 metacaspase-1 isoform X3 [Brachypodium distachyon]